MPQRAGDVVIFPRVRWREPSLNVFTELVTCQTASVSPVSNDNVDKQLTSQFVHIARNFWNDLCVESDTVPTNCRQLNLRRASRTLSIDSPPATGKDTLQSVPNETRANSHHP
jgi:hypothetical protein